MPTTASYKDIALWQHAVQLAADISSLASRLPQAENLTVTANLQDAALSIPVLIARSSRASRKTFMEACLISRQTIAEIETQLSVIQQLYSDIALDPLFTSTQELDATLLAMARRLSPPAPVRAAVSDHDA